MAAVAAARHSNNNKVLLLSVTHHIGGMCSGGLGSSDVGPHPMDTIGGLAWEFFERNGAWYNSSSVEYKLEPHVARAIFRTMLEESGVEVVVESGNVVKVATDPQESRKILSLATENGHQYSGTVFIDASYEGDLLAQAGISHVIGREDRDTYGESFAGTGAGHSFLLPVDPFLDANQTQLLPLMMKTETGNADTRIPAYTFRLCVSNQPDNRVPFPVPTHYTPERWELLRRYFQQLEATNLTRKVYAFPSRLNTALAVKGKYDCNNAAAIGTDYVGGSWQYPTASTAERRNMWEEHKQYILELFYFLAHDPVVPEWIRETAPEWGLCADEFVEEEDHWPPQLYVREARRMVGETVFTQVSIEEQQRRNQSIGDHSIGLGAYNYDAHMVQRVVRRYSAQGWPFAWTDGELEEAPGMYQIPMYVLFPKPSESVNLLTPISVSASHVAFSSLRMEPQYMIMGQAAGTIASLAVQNNLSRVHDVDRSELRRQLVLDGQLLEKPATTTVPVLSVE